LTSRVKLENTNGRFGARFALAATDGGYAENAGAIFGCPSPIGRGVGVRVGARTDVEKYPDLTATDGGLSRPSMAFEALGLLPGGNAENAGAIFGRRSTPPSPGGRRKSYSSAFWRTEFSTTGRSIPIVVASQ
jgi:hypothetical protein